MNQDDIWQFLQTELHTKVIFVDFIKKDGTIRSMRCTLNSKLIDGGVPKNNNEKSLTVFDLDIKEFRKFNHGTIKKVSIDQEL